jgi:hypothetical protein
MDTDGFAIASIEQNETLHPTIAIRFTQLAGPYFKKVMAAPSSKMASQAYSMFSRVFTTIGDGIV